MSSLKQKPLHPPHQKMKVQQFTVIIKENRTKELSQAGGRLILLTFPFLFVLFYFFYWQILLDRHYSCTSGICCLLLQMVLR